MNDKDLNDKVVQGKLIGFGHAPYKDDTNNQPSYYVELETASGKNKFWGWV
jgi:citrate synthase